jgi:hypothetical protein
VNATLLCQQYASHAAPIATITAGNAFKAPVYRGGEWQLANSKTAEMRSTAAIVIRTWRLNVLRVMLSSTLILKLPRSSRVFRN